MIVRPAGRTCNFQSHRQKSNLDSKNQQGGRLPAGRMAKKSPRFPSRGTGGIWSGIRLASQSGDFFKFGIHHIIITARSR